MQNPKVYRVEISAKTIVFTIFFTLLLALIWVMKDLLLSLFLAFIIMSAVRPLINKLQKLGAPRQLSIAGVFIIVVSFFVIGSFWIFPPLINETSLLVKHLPAMIQNIKSPLIEVFNFNSVFQYVPNITNQVFHILSGFLSNATFLVTTLFFAIYLTSEEKFLKNSLGYFFGEKDMERAVQIVEKTEKRLGSWLLGELMLMLIVGGLTFIGLSLIGVKYALPLSIIAGLLEVVPNIGPVLSTVPAFIVAITQSYFLGFATIALYFIVQQLENHIIVPFIMNKVIGLSPIITLIALIIGGRLFGVLGILLAIPFTLFVETLIHEIIYPEAKQQ